LEFIRKYIGTHHRMDRFKFFFILNGFFNLLFGLRDFFIGGGALTMESLISVYCIGDDRNSNQAEDQDGS